MHISKLSNAVEYIHSVIFVHMISFHAVLNPNSYTLNPKTGEDVYGYGLEGLRERIPGPAGTSVRLGFKTQQVTFLPCVHDSRPRPLLCETAGIILVRGWDSGIQG